MTAVPASAGRPRFDIADIVRQHRAALEAEEHLTLDQRRVLSAIAVCRTAALGGHLDVCRSCGYEHPSYNSCRDRHCPKCQGLEQERWIAARSERLLPVRHFHVVFTLPSELRALTRYRSREIFDALFSAASATLLELGQSRFGALLGVTMVLHTWKRDLGYHPHTHAIVTAGGLNRSESRWVASYPNYLFPTDVLQKLLRGKMLAALRELHATGSFAEFDEFRDPEGFERLMARLARSRWHVYVKKPFRQVEHVLAYLGRYTHRVAISNSRLLSATETAVTFRTKNGGTATLAPVEFLRRFVRHVLPDAFHKIRHYGVYSGVHVHGALAVARCALQIPTCSEVAAPVVGSDDAWDDLLRRVTGRDVHICPRCSAPLEHLPLPRAENARAPPAPAAA